MSIANLFQPNNLTLYCSHFSGLDSTLSSFSGIIFEQCAEVTVPSGITVPLIEISTIPDSSYDADFIITGICISGPNIGDAYNQNTRTKFFNATGIPVISTNYVNGTYSSGDTTTVRQMTPAVIDTDSVEFGIVGDTRGGNTWLFGYYFKVVQNN